MAAPSVDVQDLVLRAYEAEREVADMLAASERAADLGLSINHKALDDARRRADEARAAADRAAGGSL